MADESYVQVAQDASGKKIRNLLFSVMQPDGTAVEVYMPVVAIADANGTPFEMATLDGIAQSLQELNEQLFTLTRIAQAWAVTHG